MSKKKGRVYKSSATVSDSVRVLHNIEKSRIGKRNGKPIVRKTNEPEIKKLRGILSKRDSYKNKTGKTQNGNALTQYKKRVNATFKPIFATDNYSDSSNNIKWFISGFEDKNGKRYNIRDNFSDECNAYKTVGLFRRMVLKHCPPNDIWVNDIENKILNVYYIARKNGMSVSYARQKAKMQVFPTFLEYSQRARKYWSSYKAKKSCTCSECHRGKTENCLNGTYQIQYETILDLDAEFGNEINDGRENVLLMEILATSKGIETAKDGKINVDDFVKRLWNIANFGKDEINTVILQAMIWGQSQTEIEKWSGISRREIKRRLLIMGKRYKKRYLKPILDNGKTVNYSRNERESERK